MSDVVLSKEDIENLGAQIFFRRSGCGAKPQRVVFPHQVDVVNGVLQMWVPKEESLDTTLQDGLSKVDTTGLTLESQVTGLLLVECKGIITVLTPDGSGVETKPADEN